MRFGGFSLKDKSRLDTHSAVQFQRLFVFPQFPKFYFWMVSKSRKRMLKAKAVFIRSVCQIWDQYQWPKKFQVLYASLKLLYLVWLQIVRKNGSKQVQVILPKSRMTYQNGWCFQFSRLLSPVGRWASILWICDCIMHQCPFDFCCCCWPP